MKLNSKRETEAITKMMQKVDNTFISMSKDIHKIIDLKFNNIDRPAYKLKELTEYLTPIAQAKISNVKRLHPNIDINFIKIRIKFAKNILEIINKK